MLRADLTRLGFTGDVLRAVQRHGYLEDWTPARWAQAEAELVQVCLVRTHPYPQAAAMAGAGAGIAAWPPAATARCAPG